MKRTDARAVGRARTEEERKRRHIHGDAGAKFSQGKYMVIMGGGNWNCHHSPYERQSDSRDI